MCVCGGGGGGMEGETSELYECQNNKGAETIKGKRHYVRLHMTQSPNCNSAYAPISDIGVLLLLCVCVCVCVCVVRACVCTSPPVFMSVVFV